MQTKQDFFLLINDLARSKLICAHRSLCKSLLQFLRLAKEMDGDVGAKEMD